MMSGKISKRRRDADTAILPYSGHPPKMLCRMLTVIVAVFPGLVLFSRTASDVCLFLLVLSAVWVALSRKSANPGSFRTFLIRYWPLCLAMGSMLIAVLLNQVFVTGFRAKYYDLPLRFLMVPLIVYVLLSLSSREMRQVQWGLTASPLVCVVFMYVMTKGGAIRPFIEEQTGYLLICFTNLCLLLGFLSFATAKWDRPQSRWIRLLKGLALLAALCVAILSQTRASYISAIVFAVVVTGLFFRMNKKRFFVFLAVLAVVLVSFFSVGTSVKRRVDETKSDIVLYGEGRNKDTSVGIRLQLFQASWMIFREYPLFGTGNAGFDREMKKMAEKGIISPSAAQSGHSHNEFLNRMVLHGFFGGMAVILCTLLPLFYFFPYRHSEDEVLKTVSWMGLLFCTGFFLFGLSDSIYVWRGSVNYYVVILSILLALLIRRKIEVGSGE